MPTFAVTYGDDAARDEIRPIHKDFLGAQYTAGTLRASGPINDETPGALLIISAESADEAAKLMDSDPLMQHGLIAKQEIRNWNIVFGGFADN